MGIVRKTKSVNLILDVFRENQNALSGVHLVKHLKASMNKTTVYRILDRLEQEGLIHSFTGKEGLKWYAKCSTCTSEQHADFHPHFQCKTCGTVECLSIDIAIPKISDRKIDSAEIMLQGICPNCLH